MLEKSLRGNSALAHFLVLTDPDSNALLVFLLLPLFFGFNVSSIKSPVFPMVTQLPFASAPLAFLYPAQPFAKRMTQSSGSPAQSGGVSPGPSQLTLSKASSGTRASQLL